MRRLEDAPARARSAAYGGDPSLDRVRTHLTYRRLVREGRPRSVLEVGFGTGALLRRFIDEGVEVIGVDTEQLGLRVDEEVSKRGRLVRATIERAQLPPARVDLVYGIHVIEHVDDVTAAVRAMLAALRPGGRIHLVTPTADCRELEVFGAAWWMLEDPTHLRFFSPLSAREMLTSAGVRGVRISRLRVDSISSAGASVARCLAAGHPENPTEHGVLSHPSGLAAATLAAPVALGLRALRPRWCPTLEISGVRDTLHGAQRC